MSTPSQNLKQKLSDVDAWIAREFTTIRTGRATPAVLDSVNVEFYGASNKISHVAAVSSEDAKTLRIAPWDKSAIKPIESAIQAANLGVSVIVDGEGLRIVFPDLTADRRKLLEKLVSEKHEEARIAGKREREEVWNQVVKEERDGELSEDEKFKARDDMQKEMDYFHQGLEEHVAKKLKEIAS